MQTELAREQAQLLLPGMPKPYFIEYRIDDFASYELLANFGSLVREESGHQRVVRVTVRVGSYDTDSSTTRGEGTAAAAAPTDDNSPVRIRYGALWAATDEAYKNALRAYSAKQAALKRFEGTPQEKDFAPPSDPAKPVTHIAPLVPLEIDRAEWKRRIVDASGLYASDPEVRANAANVQYSSANLRSAAVNRYLVNTEGAVVREGYSGYAADISLGTQAPDGMELSRENGSVATATRKELESWAAFRKRTIERPQKPRSHLRNAPVVPADDYHGPVLFSGDAAASIMKALFIPNVRGRPPGAGRHHRAHSRAAYTSQLPRPRAAGDFLSVTDDPAHHHLQR